MATSPLLLFERRKIMLKKTITYEDYNGVERKEDHYFNLTKSEIVKMEGGVTGGYLEMLKRIINTNDTPALMNVFEDLIRMSYGVKTPDGRGFDKNPAHFEAFKMTLAYDQLFLELFGDAEKLSAFVVGLVPADLAKEIEKYDKNELMAQINN